VVGIDFWYAFQHHRHHAHEDGCDYNNVEYPGGSGSTFKKRFLDLAPPPLGATYFLFLIFFLPGHNRNYMPRKYKSR